MGAVTRILERGLGVNQLLVHVLGVTGCGGADVGIPGAHGEAGRVVGVQRDGVSLFLDELEVGDELFRSGRQLGDAGLLEDGLVVDDAGGLAVGGDAVGLAVVGLLGGELDLLLHGIEGAVGDEVVLQFGLVDRRNHHDVAPVAALQAGQRVIRVVGVGLGLDLDVRIDLVEVGDVGLPVLARIGIQAHVGTAVVELDAGRNVLAGLAELDLVVGQVRHATGVVAATASCHAHRADGRDTGCDDLLEIHLLILPYESLVHHR